MAHQGLSRSPLTASGLRRVPRGRGRIALPTSRQAVSATARSAAISIGELGECFSYLGLTNCSGLSFGKCVESSGLAGRELTGSWRKRAMAKPSVCGSTALVSAKHKGMVPLVKARRRTAAAAYQGPQWRPSLYVIAWRAGHVQGLCLFWDATYWATLMWLVQAGHGWLRN